MEQILRELGVTKANAARYFGVSRNTIYAWFKSEPVHVMRYLEGVVKVHREIMKMRGKG